MARTRTGDEDLAMPWMIIEDEMFVRRVGVQAHDGGFQTAFGGRQKTPQQFAQGFGFVVVHFAPDGLRLRLLALMMDSHLHAVAEVGEPIEEVMRPVLPYMDGAILRLEPVRLRARLAPEEHPALPRERQRDIVTPRA